MKKKYIQLFSLLIITSFLASCKMTVTKRHYRKGHYVDIADKNGHKAKLAQTNTTTITYYSLTPNQPNTLRLSDGNSSSPELKENFYPTRSYTLISSISKREKNQEQVFSSASKSVKNFVGKLPVLKNNLEFKKAINADKDDDGLSLFWIIILVLLILWALGLIGGYGGGLIYILLVVALILLILWLLKIL
jgi:hypothetical protein